MATATQGARAAAREMRSRAIPHTVGSPPLRVVLALAWVEARKMLRHPAYPLGLGIAVVLVGLPRGGSIKIEFLMMGLGLSLVLGSLFAANLGALRSRRDGTDELFGSAPAPLAARTAGHLAAVAVGPVAVTCAWAIAVGVMNGAGVGDFPDELRPVMLVQAPLMVAAIGTLGVATARLIPHVVGGPIVLALHMFTGLIWWLPWAVFEEDLSVNLWHLGYLVSAIVVLSSVAFLRDRVRALPAIGLVVGLSAAVLTALQRVPDGGW
jgi:hypothetical protein